MYAHPLHTVLWKEKFAFAYILLFYFSLSISVSVCRLTGVVLNLVLETSSNGAICIYTSVDVKVNRCIILCVSNGHGEEQSDICPHEAVGEFYAAKHIDHVKSVSIVVHGWR